MRSTDLATLRAERDALHTAWQTAGKALQAYPRGAVGLVLDSAKGPQWRADRAACDTAFAALQAFNKRNRRYLRAITDRGHP